VTRTAGMVTLRGCGFDANGPAGVAGAEEARAAGELVLGLAAPRGGICHGGGGESTPRVEAYRFVAPTSDCGRSVAYRAPRVRVTQIHAPEIAPTSGSCRLSQRQLDACERAVSAGCSSGVLLRPALTVGEPFEQALAHALDALR